MTKIMIVDDEQDTRDMINIFLQKEGFETETASDGNEFLEQIETFEPDLVTLDIMMPGPDTKEILQQLRNREISPKIILVTVMSISESEFERMHQLGNIVDYIKKPFELDSFLSRIHHHI